MPLDITKTPGLNSTQILAARKKFGQNILSYKKENGFLKIAIGLFKEPMVIL